MEIYVQYAFYIVALSKTQLKLFIAKTLKFHIIKVAKFSIFIDNNIFNNLGSIYYDSSIKIFIIQGFLIKLINYLDLLLFLIYIVYYTPYLNYNRIIAMRFVKQKIIDKAKQNYLQNLFSSLSNLCFYSKNHSRIIF